MDNWHRPYEVNRLRPLARPFLTFLVLLLCCTGGPFTISTQLDWRRVLNPWTGTLFLAALVFGWLGARTGVYLGDGGVMVRVAVRSTVVPWHEIAYAEVAEVPKRPVILQRGPSLGLVLVAPSGQRRALPARLATTTFLRMGRGAPPYVILSQEHMTRVVNRINELAAGNPRTWQPPGGSPFPPR